jgi:hypothetical protein
MIEARQMGFMAIAYAVCAITNCPLSHPVTTMLFVYVIAQFYSVTPYYSLKRHVT